MLFQERALQEGVHAMIQVLEDNLIANRQPKSRAVSLVEQFLNHPDIKKAISEISKQQFGWGVKQQLIMAAVLGHAQEMVAEHKLKRNKVSLVVMQVTPNPISLLHLLGTRTRTRHQSHCSYFRRSSTRCFVPRKGWFEPLPTFWEWQARRVCRLR